MMFTEFISLLQSRSEEPIDPEVEKVTTDKQRELRELQELKQGAVRSAVLQQGKGAAVKDSDVVILRARCCSGTAEPDQMTFMAHELDRDGGTVLVAPLCKGQRLPRGWELVLANMTEGQTNTAITADHFGFNADGVAPIDGVKCHSAMSAVLHLARVIPSAQAHPLAASPGIVKIVSEKGEGWQTPRAPCEVTASLAVTPVTPAFDKCDLSWQQHTATLGQQQLAAAVEEAVGSMAAEESAIFVMQTESLTSGHPAELPWLQALAQSAGPTVMLHIKLHSFVEVRDMTGDGRVRSCLWPCCLPASSFKCMLHARLKSL